MTDKAKLKVEESLRAPSTFCLNSDQLKNPYVPGRQLKVDILISSANLRLIKSFIQQFPLISLPQRSSLQVQAPHRIPFSLWLSPFQSSGYNRKPSLCPY